MNTVRTRKRLQELFDAERRRLRSPSPRPTSPMGSTIIGTHSPTCRMASPSPPPRSPVGPGKTYQHYWEGGQEVAAGVLFESPPFVSPDHVERVRILCGTACAAVNWRHPVFTARTSAGMSELIFLRHSL
ncbi:hypothetical protein MTO96_006215 [Rhipicephalus appendiculatus]